MKNLMLGTAAALLAVSGPAGSATQMERRQNATVELNVVDDQGKSVQLAALPEADRQRVISLRNSLQQWGNQQSQRVTVTISCTFRPLRCSITVAF